MHTHLYDFRLSLSHCQASLAWRPTPGNVQAGGHGASTSEQMGTTRDSSFQPFLYRLSEVPVKWLVSLSHTLTAFLTYLLIQERHFQEKFFNTAIRQWQPRLLFGPDFGQQMSTEHRMFGTDTHINILNSDRFRNTRTSVTEHSRKLTNVIIWMNAAVTSTGITGCATVTGKVRWSRTSLCDEVAYHVNSVKETTARHTPVTFYTLQSWTITLENMHICCK